MIAKQLTSFLLVLWLSMIIHHGGIDRSYNYTQFSIDSVFMAVMMKVALIMIISMVMMVLVRNVPTWGA